MVHFRVCFLLRIYFILLLVKLWTNMSHIWHYHTKYVALILWQYCLYTTYFHVDVCSASSFSNTWELCPNLSVFGNDHNFATTLLLSLSPSFTPKKTFFNNSGIEGRQMPFYICWYVTQYHYYSLYWIKIDPFYKYFEAL